MSDYIDDTCRDDIGNRIHTGNGRISTDSRHSRPVRGLCMGATRTLSYKQKQ